MKPAPQLNEGLQVDGLRRMAIAGVLAMVSSGAMAEAPYRCERAPKERLPHCYAVEGMNAELRQLLQSEQPTQHALDEGLLGAADECNKQAADMLLKAGANPKYKGKFGDVAAAADDCPVILSSL